MRRLALFVPAVAGACAGGRRRLPAEVGQADGAVEAPEMAGPVIRVGLPATAGAVTIGGESGWRVQDADGRGDVVLRGGGGERWRVETRDGRLRVVRDDGAASGWRAGPLVVRPSDGGGLVAHNGRRYRGELALVAGTGGVRVVNRLPLEDYLRGVVPLELGARAAEDRAALEAQAIAARSYALVRLRGQQPRDADLGTTTLDQVYGGADAERALADAAIRATAGRVLLLHGRPVSAPYHSTCGGGTAEATEVWKARSEPHLQRVSDGRPGGGHWCDAAPRFRWERSFEREELRRLLDQHLGAYATLPAGGVGAVEELRVEQATPSGRVGVLAVVTRRGTFRLRGNDMRFVLRERGGAILNSTHFSIRRPPARRGESGLLATLQGSGYGHGIGMCQWGALGRARAGHDAASILRAYYPGTSVGYAD